MNAGLGVGFNLKLMLEFWRIIGGLLVLLLESALEICAFDGEMGLEGGEGGYSTVCVHCWNC